MLDHTPDPTGTGVHEALGQSEAFVAFQEQLSRVAKVDRPVLVIGERGTGKELAAQRLHYLSGRWQEPFVALNCSALSPSLIESELFGHEAGAFTGAARQRKGRFEAANNGTLFLDEIGLIPLEVQEKILRVVEYGAFERVGSSAPSRVDVRIVAATNADVPALADEGRFKRDLLDRLSFEVLFLPPLRERAGDALLLANHFAAHMAHELGRNDVPEFTDNAVEALEQYPWPGNVRELKNVIERAVYRSDSSTIDDGDIVFDPFQSPFAPQPATAASDNAPSDGAPSDGGARPCAAANAGPLNMSLEEAVRDLEVRMMKQALARAQFNQRKAADLLGLTYHQFRGLYRKYKDQRQAQ
ncbi:MAG TPA: phage shock protein operon transcriptional activator [Candidatus Hydrogenedentes bacterium]|nr:phage shock protein operon transcriptional activator [Candidatus Hydrogenedentota bacterium]